jgi:uncharacterized protein YbjT (DUF2867 family)
MAGHISSADIVLITGATGYVGSRLLRKLESDSLTIRCLTRNPQKLQDRTEDSTEVMKGDVLDTSSLAAALQGIHTAYYLVHSLDVSGDFAMRDRIAAKNFAQAARNSGVRKIIYLGGLGKQRDDLPLSAHLASRQEVGAVLRNSGVPTVEFRASIIIGADSLSFEMVRALVERLPVMTTPRWVRTLAQPIAIEDVLAYLEAALDFDPPEDGIVFEIGGADTISYEGIMRAYAAARNRKRLIIPVPVLSPGLSSLWLGLVTPLYARIGRHLIEGVRNETVVTDKAALRVFPIQPKGIHEAIRSALASLGSSMA